MSEYGQITAKVRTKHGKGAARQLRREGMCPAVVYGQKSDNISLTIDPHAFQKATDPALHYNTLFQITIEGDDGSSQVVPCLVVDFQRNAIKDDLMHIDFLRVDLEQDVLRKVPVRYFGRAAGVVIGGKLKTFRRHVKVLAKPGAIPKELAVDVTPLEAGHYLRISDVSLEGATFQERADSPLAFIEAPKAKKEDEDDKGKKAKK